MQAKKRHELIRPLPPEPEQETVFVACKLPNGLHLDLSVKGQLPRRLTLAGTNTGIKECGVYDPSRMQNGFALTPVPKKFFEDWLEQHRFHPAVVNGHIFANTNAKSAVAEAREKEKAETGLEPMPQKAEGVEPLAVAA
jgi:hypothetical protein